MIELPKSTEISPLLFFEIICSNEGIGLLYNKFNEKANYPDIFRYDAKTMTYFWPGLVGDEGDEVEFFESYESFITQHLIAQIDPSILFARIRLDATNTKNEYDELAKRFKNKIQAMILFIESQNGLNYKEVFLKCIGELSNRFQGVLLLNYPQIEIAADSKNSVKQTSFQFDHRLYDSDKLLDMLKQLDDLLDNKLVSFERGTTINDLHELLVSKDYSIIEGKIFFACQTNIFCTVLDKLEVYFENFTRAEIGRSQKFAPDKTTSKKNAATYLSEGNINASLSKSKLRKSFIEQLSEICSQDIKKG